MLGYLISRTLTAYIGTTLTLVRAALSHTAMVHLYESPGIDVIFAVWAAIGEGRDPQPECVIFWVRRRGGCH